MILFKNKSDIENIHASGQILGRILDELVSFTQEGKTLKSIDMYAQELVAQHGALAAFLGYQPEGAHKPFPAAICTSLNEVVVHGIPSEYALRKGDVVTIDMGIVYQGMYSDAARTVPIGKPSLTVRNLITATQQALEDGIAMARIGNTTGDIGWAIQNQARKHNVKVIKTLTGHGVGFELHEDPPIYNFGKKGEGVVLKEGMVLAIEPMFSIGSEDVIQYDDESYATADGSISAHSEDTIAITKKGPRILTRI